MKPSTIPAAWPTNYNNINNLKPNPKALDSSDMLLEFSHKSGVDLIRNCDLPPPQKVFTNSEAAAMGRGRKGVESGGMEEKMEVLKALRLSQTRAREAERKAGKLMEERDAISRAFEDEARLIFCYKQTVKLLELRVSKLQKEEENCNGGGGGMKWGWALAICGFSVVGVSFLLGYSWTVHQHHTQLYSPLRTP